MKKLLTLFSLSALSWLLTFNASAQIVVNSTVTAQDLVNAISGNGVIISNVSLNCPTGAFGTFSNGGGLGMTDGIVLTTGTAANAAGPNTSGSASGGPCTSYSDDDLVAIEPQATNDVCILEFDIVPQCDILTLDYIFGSDEYPEFVNSSFNDAFAFFISGPNPGGGNYNDVNIALIPGTSTPVSIDNVNPTSNTAYYVNNTGGTDVEYDGITTLLTATVNVDQCATYHMKLIIADAGDCSYDSGVFLDFEGLNCPNNDVDVVYVADAYEGCGDGHFQITRTDVSGSFTVTTSTGGSATEGTDYSINSSYTFSPGQGTLDVTFPAVDDNLVEGTENAWIYITWLVCNQPITDSVEILIHDEIHVNFTTTDPACGACDGVATANVTGGTPAYSYQWDAAAGNATTPTITNLCAGTYCVTVTDVNGCVETQCVTLSPSSSMTLTVNTTDETCQGDTDGTISASTSGGSGNYTYDIGGAGQASGNFSGLAPGSYTVTVTDNTSGCTATQIVTINAGPVCCAITPTAIATDESCNGACDGTATATPTGAVAPFTYEWFTGAGVSINQTTQTATGLCAGTYYVDVTDVNCTVSSATVTVNSPPAVTASATEVPVSCNGACDGEINIVGGGGTPPLTYSIDGTNFQASPNFTGQCAGTYTATVMDANNCTETATVTVTEPPVVTASATEVPVSCNGACDGEINILGGGGVPPLTYSIDGTNFQALPNFTGQCAGTYTVTVMDANNCTETATVTVTEPPAVTASASEVPVTCNGACDGEINIVGGGGIPPLTYSIDGTNFQASPNFTAQCAGTYTATVMDANNCTETATVTVTEPPAVTASATEVPVSCNGACDGEINIVGGGGVPPLTYSIDGTNFQASPNFTGQCAGTFTVTVMDANNCSETATVTVTEPTTLVLSVVNVIDATCGQNNGEITVSASGGSAPYTYDFNTGVGGQPGGTCPNLGAGTYTVDVTDANGCVETISVVVQDQSGLVASIASQVNVSCNGLSDGSVTINAGGSVSPYLWSIDGVNFAPVNTYNGLAAGNYTVTVEDGNGCQVTVAVTITEPTALTISGVEIPASCNGVCDGQINAAGGGGTGALQYSIDGLTFQSGTNFNGLCAGNYTLTIMDANNCTATAPVTVTEPTAVTFTSTTTNSTCGLADGSITLTGSGGTAGYQYSLNNGALQASGTFNGLMAGTYTMMVEDANGCQYTNTVNVSNDAAPVITNVTFVDPTCAGSCDGSLTVTATGGTGGLQYSINSGALQASNNFTGLCAGTYDIMVEDGSGCQAFDQVVLTDPAAVTYTAAITDLTCYQDNTGSIDITANGGDNTYTYSIDGVNFQASNVFNGLAAGTYTVTVMDGVGCTVTGNETVTEPAELTMTFSAFDANCFGNCDGSAIVIPAGGTVLGLYDFQWTAAGVGNTANATNLCAGTYTLTVTDDNGCFIDTTFTINEPAAFTIATSATPSTCNQPDGTASVDNVTGGAGGYGYLWDAAAGNQNTATATGLVPGAYDVTISDANGCDSVITVVVPNAPGVVGQLVATTDVTCNGVCDGTAEVSASGGTTPYTYLWSDGQITPIATGLCAGNHSVTITDATGCTDIVDVTIVEPAAVTLSASADTIICIGGTVTLTANAAGGIPAFTYDWNNGAFAGATITDNPNANASYTVVATDANGCTSPAVTVNVTLMSPLSVVMSPSVSICPGETADISGAASGGDGGPYTYNWTNNAGGGWTGAGANQTVAPNQTTMYYLTVTDGCETPAIIDSVEVIINPTPAVSFSADVLSGCEPLTVTFTNTTNPADVGANCLWDFGDGNTSTDCNTVTHTYPNPGTYDVTLTFDSPNGCTGTSTQVGYITVHPNPVASFDFNPDPATIQDPTVCFNNTSVNGSTYDWYFSDLDSASMENPCYTFEAPGDYPVMLVVTSQFGCVDVIMDTVTVQDVFSIYVPNAFTPDDDGLNDFFYPQLNGHDVTKYSFLIYDRWGELIYQTDDPDGKWDGTYRGLKVKQDVYVWKVIVSDGQEGEEHQFVGHVSVLR